MRGQTAPAYALIDPVGSKAGMDRYDIALAVGLAANGMNGFIFSNFSSETTGAESIRSFHNLGRSKPASALNTLTGFLKSLLLARGKQVEWIIVHVFTAGIADALLIGMARLMGFRICGIVHDIESLDEYSPGSIRKRVIGRMLDTRIVHNKFSFDELVRLGIIHRDDPNTHILPHVHYIQLFEKKTEPSVSSQEFLALAEAIHPALKKAVASNMPVLLFFGQIKKPKGLDLLLRAFREVQTEAVLVVAGKTRDEPWNRYGQLIHELGLEGSVIPVIRHITDQERDLLFSVSRAVILPYTRIYQSGVLLMAMSYPLAVIASDLPPNRDTIVDKENGLLFKSGDEADLVLKLKKTIGPEGITDRLRQNALETMRRRHDPSTIGRHLAEIIRAGASRKER